MNSFCALFTPCPRHICIAVVCAMPFWLLSGCANLPSPGQSSLDARLDKALDTFCPIAADSGKGPTEQERTIRARFVLSAITGYAVLSTSRYSGAADFNTDAARALTRVIDAYKAIGKSKTKEGRVIYPVYHADMVVELAQAAEAAVRPTVRAGAELATASVSGRIETLKSAYIALLEDEIYLAAYKRACGDLAAKKTTDFAEVTSDLTERTKTNCQRLATLAGQNAGGCAASIQ